MIPRAPLYILIAIVAVSLIVPAYSSSLFVFERSPTLEKSLGTTTFAPIVVANGTKVYALYNEGSGTQDILRLEKTDVDSPTTYTGAGNFYDSGFAGNLNQSPALYVDDSSDRVWVAAYENGGGGGFDFVNVIRSSDGGESVTAFDFATTFPDGFNLVNDLAATASLKITADSGTDTFNLVFVDEGYLKFIRASYLEDGTIRTPTAVNGTTAVTSISGIDMIQNGTKLYFAYELDDGGGTNIGFARSINSGTSWTVTNLSNSGGTASTVPKLSLSGDNVYVIWQENTAANSEVHFRSYNAATTTFGPDIRLDDSAVTAASLTPQIASSGSNVYAVWADKVDTASNNQEIVMRKSADSGGTFASSTSISSSTADSSTPKISAQGTNLHVVWEDKTIEATQGELWFRTSSDSGATFGGLQIISEAGGAATYPSPIPEISSSSSTTAVVWKKSTPGGPTFVKPANVTSIDLSFDKIEYASTDSATITVRDTPSLGTIDVGVIVDVGNDNAVTLTEGSAGVYTNTIDISAAPHSAADGSTIQVNYPTSFGNFTSFSHVLGTRSIAWDPNNDPLILGVLYGLSVNDASSNINPFVNDTITVSLTTTSVGGGTTLDTDSVVLSETNTNTGIFSSTENIVFMPGDYSPLISETVTITSLNDTVDNIGLIETNRRLLNSTSDPTGVTITLTETSLTSNTYTADISFCGTPGCSDAATKTVYAQTGDFFGISLLDGTKKTHGVIDPMLSTRRALIVNDALNSEVDITFNGLSVLDRTITDAFSPGGGGGGVSRAGLVVNALASVSSLGSGGGADGSAPITSLGTLISNKNFEIPDEIISIVDNFDSTVPLQPIPISKYADFDMPLTINENGYPLGGYTNTIQTFSTGVGKPITITSLYYEQTALQHVSMYLNLRGITQGDLSKSDTQILYNKDKPISIVDPNGFFESVSMNVISDEDGLKKFAQFEITFAKPMDTSDIVMRSWDDRLRSMDTIIYDAIEVTGSEDTSIGDAALESESVENLVETTAQDTPKVPEWIKSNAKWWSEGTIDDTTFKNGLQFLIQEHMIDVPIEPHASVSTDDLTVDEIRALEEIEERVIAIPEWIKSNAEWWSQGIISEDEFLTAIEYMVKNKIIEI